jgi:hypothetical protein
MGSNPDCRKSNFTVNFFDQMSFLQIVMASITVGQFTRILGGMYSQHIIFDVTYESEP